LNVAKLLVDESSDQDRKSHQSSEVLSHPAAVDLSGRTLRYAAGLLRAHRRLIGSQQRKLRCGRQAPLVLAHLRCGDTCVRLAAGFDVGAATVHRDVSELVDLLAAATPGLAAAMDTARCKAYVGLDGTLIALDRVGMLPRPEPAD
jgi:hypothetical protein